MIMCFPQDGSVIAAGPRLLVDSLVVHELPDPIHPGIAAGSRGGRPLEAVATFGEGVEVRLNSHPAKLLLAFH